MKKPQAKDFCTNNSMHAAMRMWAAKAAKRVLTVEVVFDDGSKFTDTFPRLQKQAKYRTQDGKTYEQDVDSAKFMNRYLPGPCAMTAAEIKAAFAEWLHPGNVSIKWRLQ